MTDLDRATADALHAVNRVRQRAESWERQFDQIEELVARIPLGRLAAVMSTLAEHEARLNELDIRLTTQERTR